MPTLAAMLDASRIAIKPHRCPKCLGLMILTNIKPSHIGYEARTFHGVNCEHVDKVVAATDLMKWACSGLRAPD